MDDKDGYLGDDDDDSNDDDKEFDHASDLMWMKLMMKNKESKLLHA